MSLYQLFDQFCLEFSLAWGVENVASPAMRLVAPFTVFSFAFVAAVFLWWHFFELLKFFANCLNDLLNWLVGKIINKIKSR